MRIVKKKKDQSNVEKNNKNGLTVNINGKPIQQVQYYCDFGRVK